MIKRLLAVLLTTVLIAGVLTACSEGGHSSGTAIKAPQIQTTAQIESDSSNLKISYTKSDSLDPFRSETLNNQVVQTLVFESLFVLDEGYNAVPQLASGYAYENSKTLNVMIPSGLRFSDGSTLDADDVVYSFQQAADSPHWKNALSCFSSAVKLNNNAVAFQLRYENPYAHNLLTFAVTAGKTDKNGFPIGSGRYVFAEGSGVTYLKPNRQKEDFSPHIVKITLVNIPSEESVENAINIGNITYAYRDLSSGSKAKMQCAKKAVMLNNLVFLGINGKRGVTKNPHIRKAISLAADRDTLVKSAYRGYAKSAVSVFNPDSAPAKQTAAFSATAEGDAARQAIADSREETLKLNLLTNKNEERLSAAMLIKQQLEAVGFSVNIVQVNNKQYKKLIKNGSFDLYIGEIRLTQDMSLRSFFNKNGAASAGIDLEKSRTRAAYNSFLRGESEIGRFVLAFAEETPFVPLVYRQGMLCYSRAMRGDMQGYYGNFFSNIEDWYFN